MRHDNDDGKLKKPLSKVPVVETNPGKGLYETWRASLSRHDPALPEDALRIISESVRRAIPPFSGLSPEQAREEALRWAWAEWIDIDSPQAQAYLRRVLGSFSAIPWERLDLERRVREMLAKLAAEALSGALELVATHPRDRVAFHPDPIPLGRLTGPERLREEMPSEWGTVTDLRFHERDAPDPKQEPKTKSRSDWLHHMKYTERVVPGRSIKWADLEKRARLETHPGTKGLSSDNLAKLWKKV